MFLPDRFAGPFFSAVCSPERTFCDVQTANLCCLSRGMNRYEKTFIWQIPKDYLQQLWKNLLRPHEWKDGVTSSSWFCWRIMTVRWSWFKIFWSEVRPGQDSLAGVDWGLVWKMSRWRSWRLGAGENSGGDGFPMVLLIKTILAGFNMLQTDCKTDSNNQLSNSWLSRAFSFFSSFLSTSFCLLFPPIYGLINTFPRDQTSQRSPRQVVIFMIRTWRSTDNAFSALNTQPDNMLNHKASVAVSVTWEMLGRVGLRFGESAEEGGNAVWAKVGGLVFFF